MAAFGSPLNFKFLRVSRLFRPLPSENKLRNLIMQRLSERTVANLIRLAQSRNVNMWSNYYFLFM